MRESWVAEYIPMKPGKKNCPSLQETTSTSSADQPGSSGNRLSHAFSPPPQPCATATILPAPST